MLFFFFAGAPEQGRREDALALLSAMSGGIPFGGQRRPGYVAYTDLMIGILLLSERGEYDGTAHHPAAERWPRPRDR